MHNFGLPSFVIILSQKNNVIRRECAPQANIFILLPHSTPFSCLQVYKLTRLFSLFFPKLLLGHIFSGKYTPLELMARIIGNYCIEGKVVVRVNNGNQNMKISNSPVGMWLMGQILVESATKKTELELIGTLLSVVQNTGHQYGNENKRNSSKGGKV